MIDYRALLKKYMAHIAYTLGTPVIAPLGDDLLQEEVDELDRLYEEWLQEEVDELDRLYEGWLDEPC